MATAIALLTTDAEIETLAYNAGLTGSPISQVWAQVPSNKQSDASAYWVQGNRDRGRDAVVAPEMDAESRMIAQVTQSLESAGFGEVAVSKNWCFNHYTYSVIAADHTNRIRVIVAKLRHADLDQCAKLVKVWLADEQSRVAMVRRYQAAA